MLTFNLKKEWFDKIKSGEKTHEYRECKDYWNKKLLKLMFDATMPNLIPIEIEFACGYPKKDDSNKRLRAYVKDVNIVNGKHTDLAIDKDVYDIEFELVKEW